MSTTSKSKMRWVPIAVIVLLAIALAVTATLMALRIKALNEDLDGANTQIATLTGQVSDLESDVSDLRGQLTQEKASVTSLNTQLTGAESQIDSLSKNVASLQTTISEHANTIKTMRYPRQFATAEELANWLQKDNTDSLYPNPTLAQKMLLALILQIHAARDGFIITVNLPLGGQLDLVTNRAIVGDVVYEIRPWDDFAQKWSNVPVMPSYPITPESGQ